MVGELARKFAEELVRCRENSDHNRLSVEHFSRGEAALRGEEFFVHNTSLLKYEKGGWPSPPKMLTMARAYGVPVARFLKALGAEDSDICGHVVSPSQERLFESLRDPAASELYAKLQALIDSPSEESRAALAVLEMAASRLPGGKRGRRKARGAAAKPSGAKDALTVELPFFGDRTPEGPPKTWKPDGSRTVTIHDGAKLQAGYVVCVPDDSMAPELRRGDLVLADWARKPKPESIVCLNLNGEFLIRQWRSRGNQRLLHAFDPEIDDQAVGKDDRFLPLGVVLRVVERDLTGG